MLQFQSFLQPILSILSILKVLIGKNKVLPNVKTGQTLVKTIRHVKRASHKHNNEIDRYRVKIARLCRYFKSFLQPILRQLSNLKVPKCKKQVCPMSQEAIVAKKCMCFNENIEKKPAKLQYLSNICYLELNLRSGFST